MTEHDKNTLMLKGFVAKLKEIMNNRPPPIPYEPPVMPPTYNQPHGPCPSCGHCPTCGRRNSAYPEPYRIWYGDSTGGPFRS